MSEAERYFHLLRERGRMYGEEGQLTERLVRCLWYDGLPFPLKTSSGETVRVLHPGEWNFDPGPDFIGSLLGIGGRKPVRGDVEVHVSSSDWKRHGHHNDPGFSNVLLHVAFCGGRGTGGAVTRDGRTIPEVILSDLAGGGLLDLTRSLDPFDYPYRARGGMGACAEYLARAPAGDIVLLLEAAGRARLQTKARRYARWARNHGREEAFYRGMMEALGYRPNKAVFLSLSGRVRIEDLFDVSAASPTFREGLSRCYALLLGSAGLLPEEKDPSWDVETREEVAALRRTWERIVRDFGHERVKRGKWVWRGVRPTNRPERRLAAMAYWAALYRSPGEDLFYSLIAPLTREEEPLKRAMRVLLAPRHPYWSYRLRFGGKRLARSVALVGKARAGEILVNVLLPFLYAQGGQNRAAELLSICPGQPPNRALLRSRHRILGKRADAPTLLRGALRQQGLLQLERDFCCAGTAACEACEILGFLEKLKAASH